MWKSGCFKEQQVSWVSTWKLENKTRGHRIKLLLRCCEVVEWSTAVYTQQLSQTWWRITIYLKCRKEEQCQMSDSQGSTGAFFLEALLTMTHKISTLYFLTIQKNKIERGGFNKDLFVFISNFSSLRWSCVLKLSVLKLSNLVHPGHSQWKSPRFYLCHFKVSLVSIC